MQIFALPALPEPWADPHLSASMAASLLAQGRYGLWGMGAQGEGGYALVHAPEGMPAELLTLWVPEACRGKGHAKALLRHVLGTLSQPLLLEVRTSNAAARRTTRGLCDEVCGCMCVCVLVSLARKSDIEAEPLPIPSLDALALLASAGACCQSAVSGNHACDTCSHSGTDTN